MRNHHRQVGFIFFARRLLCFGVRVIGNGSLSRRILFQIRAHVARAAPALVLQQPSGIAFDRAGYVYVADSQNDRIQKFSADGRFVGKWGSTGTVKGRFQHPWGIAVDSTGNVYVTDALNSRVQKFSPDGQFLAQWGSPGSGDGQFTLPQASPWTPAAWFM